MKILDFFLIFLIFQAYPIELAEKIMEDSEEAQAYQQEISEMISGQLTEDDLEDVEKEFDELIHIELPEVPETDLEAIKEAAGITVKQKGKKFCDFVEVRDIGNSVVSVESSEKRKKILLFFSNSLLKTSLFLFSLTFLL